MAAARRTTVPPGSPLVERAIARGFSDRYAAAEEDVARIIDATYRVIERTGTVDPRVRDILDEAGFSSPTFYRHFASKDELLLVILDDGRRRLADYLEHRMAKATTGRVRAWIEGVAAQAVDRAAASRTRPFLANTARIAEQFPTEQESSQELLLALLTDAVRAAHRAGELATTDVSRDSRAVFDLSFAFMERHVLAGTRPAPADVRHLVAFCERALGARSHGAPRAR
jgi:AcrR family transcriptional regulator